MGTIAAIKEIRNSERCTGLECGRKCIVVRKMKPVGISKNNMYAFLNYIPLSWKSDALSGSSLYITDVNI